MTHNQPHGGELDMAAKQKAEGAKTKAPEELKQDELDKVTGGLLGDEIGVPVKGFQTSGHGYNGVTGKVTPKGGG
jgi:hypothetical protein